VTGNFYASKVKQSLALTSWEIRPVIGFLINSNLSKRLVVFNLTRTELRYMIYSDQQNTFGFRLRNTTLVTTSLNKGSVIEDKTLNLFGSVEFFYNSNDDLRERFVNQIKYKLGLAFRLSFTWRFDIGLMYQDAKNNVPLPSQYPTTLVSNYVLEWGVGYFIGDKKNN